jgi:mono/diheme cytochrome c family protein
MDTTKHQKSAFWVLAKGLATFLATLGSVAYSAPKFSEYLNHAQLVQTGRGSFVRNCSGCHGINADGQGLAAPMLLPRPRNLVEGSFKFRSTPSGSLPTVADLIRTLNQGIPNSSMPSFNLHSEKEKLALALYVRSLRPDWEKNVGQPYGFAPPPEGLLTKKGLFVEGAIRGKKLYMEACHTCHGNGGLGMGPGAEGLTDQEGQPIRPANLTSIKFKSGRGAKDIFRAITTGLDGSPMPAFADTYSDPQRWDLVAYVLYLRGQTVNLMPRGIEPEETLKKLTQVGSK